MIGYIKYDFLELKIKDYQAYRAIYCSLCNQIKDHFGNLYRFGLSYDIVFFMLIFNLYELDSQKLDFYFRCPLNPFVKRKSAHLSLNNYAYSAFINILLIALKAQDNVIDKKTLINSLFKGIVDHSFKNMNESYLDSKKNISAAFENLFVMEQNEEDIDSLLNTMGEIMVLIKDEFLKSSNIVPNAQIDELISELLSLMGQWIYFIDALDDIFKDQRNNEFNLLNQLIKKKYVIDIDEVIIFSDHFQEKVLDAIKERMNLLKSLMPGNQTIDILYNICVQGTVKTYTQIKDKTNKKIKSSN